MSLNVATNLNFINREIEKYHIAEAEKKLKAKEAIREVKCADCLRVLELDEFSAKQKKRLAALVRQHGKEVLAETGYISCKMCGRQPAVELQCGSCDEYKSIDDFSKNQRKLGADGICKSCAKEREEIEPSDVTMKRLTLTAEEGDEVLRTPDNTDETWNAGLTPASEEPGPSSAESETKFWRKGWPKKRKPADSSVTINSSTVSSSVADGDWDGDWGATTASTSASTSPEAYSDSSLVWSTNDYIGQDGQSPSSPSPHSTNEWVEVSMKQKSRRAGQNNGSSPGHSRGRGKGRRGGNWT